MPSLNFRTYNLSDTSGTFSTTSASPVDITNLNLDIKVSGHRPVVCQLVPDNDASNPCHVHGGVGEILFLVDSVVFGKYEINGSTYLPPGGFVCVQFSVTAGAKHYSVQAFCSSGTIYVTRNKLLVMEL